MNTDSMQRKEAKALTRISRITTNSNALKALRKLAQQRCLVCKRKVWVFEQVVHQDDQLPHHGGEGDFGRFACGDQAVVKRFEQVIAPAGRERGHVKGATDFG